MNIPLRNQILDLFLERRNEELSVANVVVAIYGRTNNKIKYMERHTLVMKELAFLIRNGIICNASTKYDRIGMYKLKEVEDND